MLRLNGLSYKNELGLIWKIFSKGFSTSYGFLYLNIFFSSFLQQKQNKTRFFYLTVKWVAQWSHLDSWLIWTTMRRAREIGSYSIKTLFEWPLLPIVFIKIFSVRFLLLCIEEDVKLKEWSTFIIKRILSLW